MVDSSAVSVERPQGTAPPDMIFIPGGTFRMGSDRHYPEEAPAHRVIVDGFFIDRTPVTNRQFKEFVRATGHKTFAEIPLDLKNWGEWWIFMRDADWRHPYGPRSSINALDHHPVVHVAYADALAYAQW